MSAPPGLPLKPRGSSGGPGQHAARLNQCVFLVGVAGGTASGKTTVCDLIMQRLHDACVTLISQDSFYRDLTEEELKDVHSYNFDAPEAFDLPLILKCLHDLRAGRSIQVPIYDFKTHRRTGETRKVDPADVMIIEGIMVLHMAEIRDLLNMKIFVDLDDDVRLARRIQRDVTFRGRDVAGVIEQYTKFVKPMFDMYIGPSRKFADVIVPWARGTNMVAVDLIAEHVKMKLQQPELRRIYANLELVPSNYQIRGMHTIIRDRTSSKNDFVFYADRLIRLVVEHALGHLPFVEKTVQTPTGSHYVGVELEGKLCGVSIIRSGESMEGALRACCKGVKIGKVLVHPRHSEQAEGGLDVMYEKLPSDIAERYVILMDPILATGNTAGRAVKLLLERGVPEGRIMLLTLIAAPQGIHKICGTFPKVTVITSEIDESVDNGSMVVPGIGSFGDRYFCE